MIRTAKHGELLTVFRAAVAAAHPDNCLFRFLPPPPERGRLIALACGKAAAAMARVAARRYQGGLEAERFQGLCVVPHGWGGLVPGFERIEAGHPAPDGGSVAAAERALRLAAGAGVDDLVLVLLSGGASALWTAPAAGVSLGDKQALTRRLLTSGAPIHAINAVRRHLSRIKGGRLALAAAPAAVVTLAISDVAGDAPETIGSGPTTADPTTSQDARLALARYGVAPPEAIARALSAPENETPKPGDAALAGGRYVIAARAADSLAAAARAAASLGYEPVVLGDAAEGEARDLARAHAALALGLQRKGARAVLLSGGEATVTVRGTGRGGPNQEYALALALALDGAPGVWALAADTDGVDGGSGQPSDPAGAIIGPDTLARFGARREAAGGRSASGEIPEIVAKNRDAATFLANNDATGFFAALGDLIVTGATETNVNDFRAIVIEPAQGGRVADPSLS